MNRPLTESEAFWSLICLLAIIAVPRRPASCLTASSYTIAFKSFAPNNTDIFIADADGTHARPLVADSTLD